MINVGLTGGYATGKSFVAAAFEQKGCHLIYADKLGHAVLSPGGAAYGPVIEAFGSGILSPDRTIDRKRLASIVFGNEDLLARLNAIVHPAVFSLEEQMLHDFAANDPQGIAMVEAAILIETGRYQVFDRLILTVCSRETQIARGIHRDGLSREQILERLARQWPLAEKRPYAHYVIDTDGTEEHTLQQVETVHRELLAIARGGSA